jgi:hypothetical protein
MRVSKNQMMLLGAAVSALLACSTAVANFSESTVVATNTFTEFKVAHLKDSAASNVTGTLQTAKAFNTKEAVASKADRIYARPDAGFLIQADKRITNKALAVSAEAWHKTRHQTRQDLLA